MTISTSDLQAERELLVKDFEALSDRIKKVEVELAQMKGNLNAVHGAVQQIDKLIVKSGEELEVEDKMPKEKAEALAMATQ